MCTTFIVHMDMGKVRSDNSSLLVLGLPCSLEQLLDLWLTNSEMTFLFIIVSFCAPVIAFFQCLMHLILKSEAGRGLV